LTASAMIRQILQFGEGDRRYVLVVEHDLAVLDYLSDYICVLYGAPGAYGVVTMPHSVRLGINAFLAGFIPSENMRFRDHSLTFKVCRRYSYQHFVLIFVSNLKTSPKCIFILGI
jgi:ATP-binding cassette, sub-family E, member 1